jgi:type VI secretion system protein ImpL
MSRIFAIFFRFLFRILGSIWFLMPFVALVLSVSFWMYGPYIGLGDRHPFDAVLPRVMVIAILWFFVLFILLLVVLIRGRKDRKLANDIAESVDSDPADEALKSELGDLRDKLRTAMTALRKSKTGRKHLYELPWYVMIGPPGAGKTTAIVNSGLQFPLADEMGKGAIGGVGGTRNCDWWFTENAVMIDTAGRYTTQESDAQQDNAAWLGFLDLIKKHRKRQPINGAMIAISLSDLSMQDETTQMAHAKAIRRRLHELREKLGVRFPVYVIFTKADLIAGFSEYFDALGKEEREQVWGFTLPLDKSKGEKSPVAEFDQEFGALLGQLNSQLLEREQFETDPQRRALIAGFPAQVASVRDIARRFLAEVFVDNRFEQRHMLRGVYFTSGTQEGTPIDRLMMGMAKTFGIGRQALGTGQGTGRSYFLTRLFDGVIFREAGLVSADDRVERRYRWTLRGAIAATLIFAIAAGALWTRSFLGNRDMIAGIGQQVQTYRDQAATIPGNPISDTDLPGIVDALNTLRDVPVNPTPIRLGYLPPLPEGRELPGDDGALGWGLYQGRPIGNEAAQAYRQALNQHLLPRLLLRLEEQLAANINEPELLFEGLKVYLMLGGQGPMSEDLVREWMTLDWQIAFAGPTRDQLRADLALHLDALLGQPMDEVSLNGPLVLRVQDILSQMPLAQRVYNGIINSAAATSLPPFRVSEVGGPAVARVFVRSSGKQLTDGIPGIYTYDGFHDVYLSEALGVAARIQRDSWVLGPKGAAQQTEQALEALSRDVLDLYYNDFVANYDQLLGDLDIVPMESLSHAVEVTNVLSGPTSPIVNILKEIAQETKLTEERAPIDTDKAAEGIGAVIADEAKDEIGVTSRLLIEALQRAGTRDGTPVKPPGAYVEERFAWLHQLVDNAKGPSALDNLVIALQAVYEELNKCSFQGKACGQSEALVSFRQAAGRVEGPLERWSAQITTGSSGIAADGTRSGIDAAWKANVLPFCTQSTANSYPFNKRAAADMGMQDFKTLFAPGGLIDKFFQDNLVQLVDQSTRPWSWKKVNDTDLGISTAVLEQLQYAAEIRDAFFAGGPDPKVTFQITPAALDPKAEMVLLEIDKQQVIFKQGQGAQAPTNINWPGEVGFAGLTFTPITTATESAVSKDGPWAWFRLLDMAEVRNTNVSDRKRVIFSIGGRIAIFQMQSGSVINPFALAALSKFKCPESF